MVAAFAVVTLGVLAGCDKALSPRRHLDPESSGLRDWNAPNHVSAQLTADRLTGGGATNGPLGVYDTRTVVVVVASGFVVQHDEYGFNADVNWGPGGGDNTLNPPKVAVLEAWANGSKAWQFPYNNKQSADTITIDLLAGHSITNVVRDATPGLTHWPWYKQSTNQYVYCNTTTSPPCYTFSGGHTIDITAPNATFTAQADSSTYSIGSTAKIAMTRSPLTINGISTPIQVDSALWSPAPDSLGGDAADTIPLNACSNYRFVGTDYLCDHVVKGAGKLTMIGHANGYRVAREVTISVRDARLTLKAIPVPVRAGDTVTLTPHWSDGYQVVVSSWKWQPDTLPNLITQDGGDCTSAQTTCRKPIRQTGWMFVTATRDGRPRTAKARVTLIPCPTGDDVLDDIDFRTVAKSAWDTSGADSKPAQDRRERGFWRWDSAGVKTRTIMNGPHSGDTPCRNTIAPDTIPLGWDADASAHIHPFQLGDRLPANCGPYPPGVKAYHGYGDGGFSGADWHSAVQEGKPGYAIDKDSVYRADPSAPLDSTYNNKTLQWSFWVKNHNFQPYQKAWPRVNANGCRIF